MAQAITCGLCDLPCGRQPVLRTCNGGDLAFCCMGCANVYAILLESGVIASGQNLRETEVFRRSLELGLISNPGAAPPAIEIDPQAPTAEMLLQVSGMWCSACAWLIEHALRGLPGVVSADVFFASDLAKVKYCPQVLPPDSISARIARLGYQATEVGAEGTAQKSEPHDLLLRLGVAAFLWANIMAFSTILYVGYFEQIAPSASRILPFVLWALATPLVFYCAWPILRAAGIGFLNRQIRMETLLSLGILSAYLLSAVQTLRGQTHVYFDTAAAIVTLVLAGKLIERAAKDRAARSIGQLYRLMPKKVRILSAADERFVSIDALQPGQVFVVKAGERIPADGVVVEGETHADESLLSGEAKPVLKQPGSAVVSGSLNAGGVIQVRATRIADQSALAQIIRLVERALSTRAPIERMVDRVARAFVPAVVILAVVDFAVVLDLHGSIAASLLRATTILVIACPCALGLATPLAITAAVGSASQAGLLISDARVLEIMGKIDVVVLDKTGTVTRGDFRLSDFTVLESAVEALAMAACGPAPAALQAESNRSDSFLADCLPLLAGVEAFSEHLLGRAVVDYAREHRIGPAKVTAVEIHKGEGISGIVGVRRIFIGNRRLMDSANCRMDPCAVEYACEAQQSGRTIAFFAWDGVVRGVLAFGDEIKPGAAEMVQRLRDRGIAVQLVSGDAWPTTAVVANQIGVTDFTAEASPAAKARIVEDLQKAGKRVALLGDGVNDAPALAQADLGLALGTGADIAMSAAPIVLMSGSLSKVEDAFLIAAKTRRIVRQNLFWAFFYNTAGIALALTGVLTPIFAAAAMLLSSASVVANSMRLARQAER
ncbi:MAG: cation-translocating P-type ATPase [Terracidiphilus sp.]|nr:cation-translocating P-type ATPase [Terracidiphilus sp.]